MLRISRSRKPERPRERCFSFFKMGIVMLGCLLRKIFHKSTVHNNLFCFFAVRKKGLVFPFACASSLFLKIFFLGLVRQQTIHRYFSMCVKVSVIFHSFMTVHAGLFQGTASDLGPFDKCVVIL